MALAHHFNHEPTETREQKLPKPERPLTIYEIKKREKERKKLLTELEESLQATKPKAGQLDEALLAYQSKLDHEKYEAERLAFLKKHIVEIDQHTQRPKGEKPMLRDQIKPISKWVAAGMTIAALVNSFNKKHEIPDIPEPKKQENIQPANASDNLDLQAADKRDAMFKEKLAKANEFARQTVAEDAPPAPDEEKIQYTVQDGDSLWKILAAKFPGNNKGVDQKAINRYWTDQNKNLHLDAGDKLFFNEDGTIKQEKATGAVSTKHSDQGPKTTWNKKGIFSKFFNNPSQLTGELPNLKPIETAAQPQKPVVKPAESQKYSGKIDTPRADNDLNIKGETLKNAPLKVGNNTTATERTTIPFEENLLGNKENPLYNSHNTETAPDEATTANNTTDYHKPEAQPELTKIGDVTLDMATVNFLLQKSEVSTNKGKILDPNKTEKDKILSQLKDHPEAKLKLFDLAVKRMEQGEIPLSELIKSQTLSKYTLFADNTTIAEVLRIAKDMAKHAPKELTPEQSQDYLQVANLLFDLMNNGAKQFKAAFGIEEAGRLSMDQSELRQAWNDITAVNMTNTVASK